MEFILLKCLSFWETNLILFVTYILYMSQINESRNQFSLRPL